MSDKFKVFKMSDFLIFGGASSIITALTIYVAANGITGAPLIMMALVSACFWAGYIIRLVMRKKIIDKITFSTKHKLYIFANEFLVKKEDIEQITEQTIKKWEDATKFDKCAQAIEDLGVVFKPFPIELHTSGGISKFAGYNNGDTIIVGYKEDLNKTAFGHEIGHSIYNKWTNTFDNNASHEFMKKHKLL